MKKFLGILAITGTLVACDNAAADAEKRTKDSTDSARVADSIRNATPVVTPEIKIDSPVIKIDSPKVN